MHSESADLHHVTILNFVESGISSLKHFCRIAKLMKMS